MDASYISKNGKGVIKRMPRQLGCLVYLEIKNIREVRNISVENRVLTEVFADQKNIVQVNIPSKKQGYFLLSKSKTMDSASF